MEKLYKESKQIEKDQDKQAAQVDAALTQLANNNRGKNPAGTDHKAVHVEKLRSVNIKLRAKLKELNNLLQKQIERKSVSPTKGGNPASISPNKNHGATSEAYQLRVKEQELANVHKQTEIYRRELETLSKKIGGSSVSGVQRLLELEQEHKKEVATRKELEAKLKQLDAIERQQSKAIGKFTQPTHEDDHAAKTAVLVNELRSWQEKVRQLERAQEAERARKTTQAIKLENVRQQNDRYKQIITEIREKQGISTNQEISEDVNERKSMELRRLSAEKIALKDKVKIQSAQQAAEAKQLENQVKEADAQLQALMIELKEKEQENRVNKLKLKEVNRFLLQKQNTVKKGITKKQTLRAPNTVQRSVNASVDEYMSNNGIDAAESQQNRASQNISALSREDAGNHFNLTQL